MGPQTSGSSKHAVIKELSVCWELWTEGAHKGQISWVYLGAVKKLVDCNLWAPRGRLQGDLCIDWSTSETKRLQERIATKNIPDDAGRA